MSSRVQAFLGQWMESVLQQRMSATTGYPTPLSMVTVLRRDAAAEGITEEDLQHEVGDLFEAMMRAMMNVPGPTGAAALQGEASQRRTSPTPAEAMRLAISYLDGFREVVKDDIDLAADLVLCNLAQQGFQLTPWNRDGEADLLRSEMSNGDRMPKPPTARDPLGSNPAAL